MNSTLSRVRRAGSLSTLVSLIAATLIAAVGGAAGAKTLRAASAAELMSRLEAARGGETILLAPGDYGLLSLYDKRHPFVKYPKTVTIASADRARAARFTGLNVAGVENLAFDGLRFDYVFAPGDPGFLKPFGVYSARGVAIRNSSFEGDRARGVGPEADGYGVAFGLIVKQSRDVVIENNRFTTFLRGALFEVVADLEVRGNDVVDMSSDGFDFAQVRDVVIEGNVFRDFEKSDVSRSHMDMIQFWTSQTKEPSVNITIRGNVLDSGTGDATQSIFMRNEEVDARGAGREMFYRDIVIAENVIRNAHLHGITVGETEGLRIENNTLVHNATTGEGGLVDVPSINVAERARDVRVARNVTPRIKAGDNVRLEGNLIIQRGSRDAENYYGALFVDGLADRRDPLEALRATPGGLIARAGLGAARLRGRAPSEAVARPAGRIVESVGGGLGRLTARFLIAGLPRGSVSRARWSFGDGRTSEALAPRHSYARGGTYEVVAEIDLTGGGSARLVKTVAIASPLAAAASFDDGRVVDLAGGTEVKIGPKVARAKGASGGGVVLGGDVASFARRPSYIGNDAYTVFLDFKPGRLRKGADRLVTFSDSFVIGAAPDGVYAAVTTAAGTKWLRAKTPGLSRKRWRRLALSYSGAEGAARLYLDGRQVAQATGLGPRQVGSAKHDLHLGGPGGRSFAGAIDNFAFLRGALAPGRLRQLKVGAPPWTALGLTP